MMEGLAQSVAVEGPRIVVFNPLPWKRDGLVQLKSPASGITTLRPVDGGPPVPAFSDGDTLQFVAKEVPPLGYCTYVPADEVAASTPEPSESELENRWFRVSLDAQRGVICSLVEKPSGRELVDPAAPHALGQYLYERFDGDQVAAYVKAYVKIAAEWAINELGKPNMPPAAEVPYRACSPASFSSHVQRTGIATVATMKAEASDSLSHGVTTTRHSL